MTVKALKKQLAAAIAMVLVSVIALSSSTYAWFASNNRVTATGMQVAAQTEGGIEIAYAQASGTGASYSTSKSTEATSAITLAPTSTVDTSAWYHARAASSAASTALKQSYETLTITEAPISGQAMGKTGGVTVGENRTDYYMVQTFNIRSTSATSLATGLTVDSVSVSGNSESINQALRVAVKLGDNVLIYDPVANDTTHSYAVYSGYNSETDAAVKVDDVTCTDKDTATLLAASASTQVPAKGDGTNGGVDVQIYIYYEGEDAQLYSDNYASEGVTITVNFSATVS